MALTLMDKEDAPVDEIDDDLEVDVELDKEEEENPNVEDQLKQTASEEGIGDEEKTKKELSVEERYNQFMEQYPEARDIHGKKTAKRIDKKTWEAKEAERQRDEAIEYAKSVQSKLEELKKNRTNQDGAFISEHKARLETELERAEQEYANAHSLNDSASMAEATKKMAKLSNQLDVAVQTETRFKRVAEKPPEDDIPVYTPPQPTRAVDPKAEAWAEDNEWFGEDKEMTEGALAIHRTLVTQDGYLPNTNAYYKELDTRMRKNYPDSNYFRMGEDTAQTGKPELKKPTSGVTPVNSNSVSQTRPGRVHLTAAQVRVAKKLGVPLKDYAKSLEEYNKGK